LALLLSGRSPVILDLEGDGFDLTDAGNGVLFDVIPNGPLELVAWTAAGSDDAWLVLDRNENGVIDDGMELFGNYTSQRPSENPNGFIALAVFDEIGFGGNEDSLIDQNDEVYADLQLWRDVDHDGVSRVEELSNLADSGIEAIDLSYERSRLVDKHGNEFRYRAAIHAAAGSPAGPDAYDVFLVTVPAEFSEDGMIGLAQCGPGPPVCIFETEGDRVHISDTPPDAASGHGWWNNFNCPATFADVTVQLQIFLQGSWFDVGTRTCEGPLRRGRREPRNRTRRVRRRCPCSVAQHSGCGRRRCSRRSTGNHYTAGEPALQPVLSDRYATSCSYMRPSRGSQPRAVSPSGRTMNTVPAPPHRLYPDRECPLLVRVFFHQQGPGKPRGSDPTTRSACFHRHRITQRAPFRSVHGAPV